MLSLPYLKQYIMVSISQLFIYPVKSLGGIALQQAKVTSRGLEHDRRWMLIDEHKNFLSQRKFPEMALFDTALKEQGLQVTYTPTQKAMLIPFEPQTQHDVEVDVWGSLCTGTYVSAVIDDWFSELLNVPCRLIYMKNDSLRQVDERYATAGHITSFADGYPMLLVSEASLNDLNGKLKTEITIARFRPNIVITGTEPYLEDRMQHFEAAGINFYGVKPCARCVMIGVDPSNGHTSTEPLKTLAGYRKANNKIYFGQNLIHNGEGIISVGDLLNIRQLGENLTLNDSSALV